MRILILPMLLLAACADSTGAAEKAEREYFVLKDGLASKQDLCGAAARAADEWRQLENSAKFQQWASFRDADCRDAQTRT